MSPSPSRTILLISSANVSSGLNDFLGADAMFSYMYSLRLNWAFCLKPLYPVLDLRRLVVDCELLF